VAPIIHNFSKTLSGVTILQDFDHHERFKYINTRLVNTYVSIIFYILAANGSFGFRIENIGTMIFFSFALFFVLLPKNIIQIDFVGLLLSYGIALNG